MTYRPQGVSNNEVVRPGNEPESNLSETAQFVKGVMDETIMPMLYAKDLVRQSNQIIAQKLSPDSSAVIDFALNCRQAEADCIEQIPNTDEKKEAVIRNYFAKLIRAVQGPGEAPNESV